MSKKEEIKKQLAFCIIDVVHRISKETGETIEVFVEDIKDKYAKEIDRNFGKN